ncbi:hypothetical protein BH10PLA2_BH10PLA2_00050 [soil metagenome]
MRRRRIPLLLLPLLLGTAPAFAAPVRRAAPPRAAPQKALPQKPVPPKVIVTPPSPEVVVALRTEAGGALKRFYAGRAYAPLWVTGDRIGPAADAFIDFVATADLDALRPRSYSVDALRDAVDKARASGDPRSVARAELALSQSFARYVRDQRRPGDEAMLYADPGLKPRRLKPEQLLQAAALSGPFADYVADMAWMSPHYVRLRALLARAQKAGSDEATLDHIRRNLDRARLLPGPWTLHIVVDASSARLFYYQGGKQIGTMKVVVGAFETQTPIMAGMLHWAILNPYWNVPTYLARNNIAPKVLSGRSLASMHMEVLSDWTEAAQKVDPAAVDWTAVATGDTEIRLRELPGGANSMGRVKFLFPNDEGIYLHDTPNRDLFDKDDRHLSNGCIRLEDAPALGRWLLRRSITAGSKAPEQYVPLPVPVPVYLTYLTATETDAGPAFREDIYALDR